MGLQRVIHDWVTLLTYLLTYYLGLILFPCSPCFLHSPSSPAVTVGGESIPWIPVLEAFIHIWRPGIINMAGYISSHIYYLITLRAKSLQSCLTLCGHMNHSLPDSSVYGILQARILKWVFIPFSRGSSWPRDRSQVSCMAGRFFTIWATREVFIT